MKFMDTNVIVTTDSPFLRGSNVALVPFARQHLEDPAYLAWLNDLEVTKHLGIPTYLMPVSFDELQRYFEANAYHHSNILFAVLEEGSGRFIGTVRLSHINWVTQTAEIGVMLGDSHSRGKRYGSEMVELIVGYAFDQLNIRKLVAGSHAANKASLGCFLRLGFQKEGILREHIYIDGEYIDYVNLALFKRDYQCPAQRASGS